MMVRNFLWVLMSGLLWTACKTADSNPVAPEYVIKGILLFDFNAQAMGKVGTPDDDILEANDVELNIFPNPARESFSFYFLSRNNADTAFTYKISHVAYPAAPDSILIYDGTPYRTVLPVVVENKGKAGQEVLKASIALDRDRSEKTIEIKDFPKGFYRLFVETNTSTRLRVAFYKY